MFFRRIARNTRTTSVSPVLAVDPGKSSGYAVFDGESLYCGQIEGISENETVDLLLDVLEEYGCGVVVLEDFILRSSVKTRDLLSPVRINAAISYGLHSGGWVGVAVELQTATDAKGVLTDARLRRKGLWVPGKDHANDAIRHMLLYLRRQKISVRWERIS